MKLTGFDNEWDALQIALQGPTGKAYTEADLKADSAMPLQKLKRQWNIRIAFTLAIAPLWVFAIIYFDHLLVKLLMSGVFIANAWSLYLSFNMQSKLRTAEKANTPVLEYLKTYYNLIDKAIKLEERVFIFIYPISVAAGFFAGASIGDRLDTFFASENETRFLLLLLAGCIAVLTPLSHLLAKWLNKLAFGNYLKELKRVIDSYENDKQ